MATILGNIHVHDPVGVEKLRNQTVSMASLPCLKKKNMSWDHAIISPVINNNNINCYQVLKSSVKICKKLLTFGDCWAFILE